MTLYLVRISQYYWDPIKKNVHQHPLCSKSISLTKEPTLEELKHALGILAKELSKSEGDSCQRKSSKITLSEKTVGQVEKREEES